MLNNGMKSMSVDIPTDRTCKCNNVYIYVHIFERSIIIILHMCVLVNSYTTLVCLLGLCVLSRFDITSCYAFDTGSCYCSSMITLAFSHYATRVKFY